ncbi:MAG: hypothetical protein ACOC9P_02335 [bacterium]
MNTTATGEPRHLAAIDAGSNGIRLAIGTIDARGALAESTNTRAAIRLGLDAFSLGWFTPDTIAQTVDCFKRFADTLGRQPITAMRAVATSAVREAENGRELVEAVSDATGIELQIIDGIEEAQLIFAGVSAQIDLKGRDAVLVDMGGGSVEVTVAHSGRALGCETLKLGPVRLLQGLRAKEMAEADTETLVERYRGTIGQLADAELDTRNPELLVIGTGGNIERMGKLRAQLLEKADTARIRAADFDPLIEKVLAMSPAKRIEKLGLRPDRADVIGIALIVMRMIVNDLGVRQVTIPGIGLKEGLLRQLARDHARQRRFPFPK